MTRANAAPWVPRGKADRLGIAAFLIANVAFFIVLALGYGIGGGADSRLLYLVMLFAVCASSLIGLDGWNGRYALQAMTMAVYFLYFGIEPLVGVFEGKAIDAGGSVLSVTEGVILVGGVFTVLGYRIAATIFSAKSARAAPRDWPLATIVIIGVALWAAGTYATYYWYFHVVTDTTNEATRRGLASLSELRITLLILAQLVQPLGVLLLAYAWRVHRSLTFALALASVVALQVVLGFIIDIKGTALLGGVLVIVAIILIDGRIPVGWLAGAFVFVQLTFPLFQAYREFIRGDLGEARTTVLQNLGSVFDRVLSESHEVTKGPDRAQTFFERMSLYGSVQMIVTRTGVDVPYQHGYTLIPLISTFVPRIIWPGKPDIEAGQLVNKAFHVSQEAATYISPSHLGELYWNFGWPGVVLGMSLIGFLFGFIGARFNLREGRTVTRLLVTVVTLHYVIQGIEGTIAVSYVVWLRSLAAIGLLHLAFARVRVARTVVGVDERIAERRAFPNLLD
ncbi:MAG: O-antigen polysaccharide polymerase Wzy [Gammaproteobacteria bacterium]|nr:O-antigen polysaccharide polymerase Wzy [Gammaproteobacteria bacterium]